MTKGGKKRANGAANFEKPLSRESEPRTRAAPSGRAKAHLVVGSRPNKRMKTAAYFESARGCCCAVSVNLTVDRVGLYCRREHWLTDASNVQPGQSSSVRLSQLPLVGAQVSPQARKSSSFEKNKYVLQSCCWKAAERHSQTELCTWSWLARLGGSRATTPSPPPGPLPLWPLTRIWSKFNLRSDRRCIGSLRSHPYFKRNVDISRVKIPSRDRKLSCVFLRKL